MSGFTFRKEPIIQMTEVLPLLNLPLFDGNDSAFLAIKAGAVWVIFQILFINRSFSLTATESLP